MRKSRQNWLKTAASQPKLEAWRFHQDSLSLILSYERPGDRK